MFSDENDVFFPWLREHSILECSEHYGNVSLECSMNVLASNV